MSGETAGETIESFTPSPYLFIVGCPRSGTTLLQRILDSHPRLAVASDTHFIPETVNRLQADADLELTTKMVARVRNYRRFPRLGLSDEIVDRAAAHAPTCAAFVGALYGEFGRLKSKPLAGEKTPDYVKHLPLLHALFPWAKIIHIIRDGRDVALSALEWAHASKGPGRFRLWHDEPVAVCALWWAWQTGTGRRDGLKLGPSLYYEVFYEDLVTQPERVMRAISEFLELPYTPEMLAFHEGKTRHEPGLSAKSAWLPPIPGIRDWRSSMKAHDLELFEALAGELLSELGYERAVANISANTAEVAAGCQAWWRGEMAERHRRYRQRIDREDSA